MSTRKAGKVSYAGTGRTVRFYQVSYQSAMETVADERARLFDAVRRAWATPSEEEAAQRIDSYAQATGMTFDEVLFSLWEKLIYHGSGALHPPYTLLPPGRVTHQPGVSV